MWWLILYAVAALIGFGILAVVVSALAGHIHALRTPDPDTLADLIRQARRERVRRTFPGLLPEDRKRR
jgi:hypothetical protein